MVSFNAASQRGSLASRSLTDTLQVWIPKVVFSTFITLSSSELSATRTLSRHLDVSSKC